MKNRYPRFDAWLTTAVSGIRFSFDKEEVRRELAAHLEDKALDLMRLYPDLSSEEAEEMALRRMGDPEELSRELAEIHKPWLGYLWTASVWLLFFACCVLALEFFLTMVVVLDNLSVWL